MKKLLALITIASLTLGSAITTFADTNAEATVTSVEVTPVPLKYTEGTHINTSGAVVGRIPRITANPAIATKITRAINDTLNANPYFNSAETNILFNTFTYEIEELALVSKIVINFSHAIGTRTQVDAILTIFVDNATGAEITEEEFNEHLSPTVDEEVEEVEETEEVEEVEETTEEAPQIEEPIMLPLRKHAEALGFEVNWNPEGFVDVVYGENTYRVLVNSNIVIVDEEEIKLPSNSIIVDGTLLVNIDFFAEILGMDITYDNEGNIIVEWSEDLADAISQTNDEV